MVLEWTSVMFDIISQLIVLAMFIFAVVVPKDVLSPGMAALSLAYAILVSSNQIQTIFIARSSKIFTIFQCYL